MPHKTSRRDLLKTAAGAGVGYWVSGLPARAESRSPHEKLNIACIGIGGRGAANVEGVRGETIVALCDVDMARGGDTFKAFPDVERFDDYRRLFDQRHKSIDAVVVSTPDHMHEPITLAAMELGKHVYCEKPLTRTVAEARRVARAAAKYPRLATQMGNGGNARSGARRSVELIRSGVIGPIREVHAWSNRPVWPQGIDRPSETPDVPDTLKWDLWLGIAPPRPYHPDYLPFKWRGWWDLGTGSLGDMACHICNVAFWALGLRDPTSIDCQVSGVHTETAPAWSIITWAFPAAGDRPALKLTWYDGGKKPDPALVEGREIPDNGSIFVGDKGTIYLPSSNGDTSILVPEEKFADVARPAETIPNSPGHHEEWIAACKGETRLRPYMSHFGRAAVMTEALLLGNLAVRTGKSIAWDAKQMKVLNLDEANAYLDPPPRRGW